MANMTQAREPDSEWNPGAAALRANHRNRK